MAGAGGGAILGHVAKRTGRKLLSFDRKLGARFVAGADEAAETETEAEPAEVEQHA